MKQDFRFELGLPSSEAVAAWQKLGGQWQFRFLEAAIVLHELRVADEVLQIWSDAEALWQPLFILDEAVIEHRPSQRGAAVNWHAFFKVTGLAFPYWLDPSSRRRDNPPQ